MPYYYVKYSDEGTDSPFIARMFMGMLELRDLIVMTNSDPRNRQITQKLFDRLYEPLLNSLRIALDAARSLNKISLDLVEAGQSGRLININPGGDFELVNTQDTQFQKEFASVIEHSAVAIKNHLPSLLINIFGMDIGLLFQNERKFKAAIFDLKLKGLDLLACYLESIRFWSNPLVDVIWNQTKHSRWRLEPAELNITTLPKVHVSLPKVFDAPVNQYTIQMVNRCCLLVEDLIVFGFQNYRLSPICLMEIQRAERPRYQNKRFQAYPKMPGMTSWILEYKDNLDIV